MEEIQLYPHQIEALQHLKNGNILCGGVGSGKSRTALAYYFIRNGGSIYPPVSEMKFPKDLYIITTARKRDTLEWVEDMTPFGMSVYPEDTNYKNKIVVDSWNNIAKYVEVKDSYFIFDEQRVVGYGVWSKSFIKISKNNQWLLLTATPGDTWVDYMPVFIANGFYKNKTQFYNEHVILDPYSKFSKIKKYVGQAKLIRLKKEILVKMDFQRKTIRHKMIEYAEYDKENYSIIFSDRWDPYENVPIERIAEVFILLRKLVNTDYSRISILDNILKEHKKIVLFYNFDCERELLLTVYRNSEYEVAEWSGHRHEDIPNGSKWIYLVQYTAGAEGWNCITTDTIVFFSQTYSYKTLVQAEGRIDRITSPFTDLYYYYIQSKSPIDIGISRALSRKKNFNEKSYFS